MLRIEIYFADILYWTPSLHIKATRSGLQLAKVSFIRFSLGIKAVIKIYYNKSTKFLSYVLNN